MTVHRKVKPNGFIKLIVHRPCIVACISFWVGLSMAIFCYVMLIRNGEDLFSSSASDDIKNIQTKYKDAWSEAKNYVDEINSENQLTVEEVEADNAEGLKLAPLSQTGAFLLTMFEADSDNLLTKDSLQSIYGIEHTMSDHEDWSSYCVLDYPKDSILDNRNSNETYEPVVSKAVNATGCRGPNSLTNIFWGNFSSVDVLEGIDVTIFEEDKFQEIVDIISKDFLPFGRRSEAVLATGDSVLVGKVLVLFTKLLEVAQTFDGKREVMNDIDSTLTLLSYMRKFPSLKILSLQDYFFDKNFNEDNLKSKYTRGTIFFGAPLMGYDNRTDEEIQINKIGDYFQNEFRGYIVGEEERLDGVMDILYFATPLLRNEFLGIIFIDLSFALGSVLFVYMYLFFQTKSAFIATVGILEIILSLPTSYFLYRHVFGFKYLAGICAMCLYIVLAIGADDIFVFMDAYKQSLYEGPEVLKSLESRMAWTYDRAATAMAITSMTTMAAFAVTAISPLAEVKSFGIFAALCILMDYLFVITWLPACLVIYHNHFEMKKSICCCVSLCSKKQKTTSTKSAFDVSSGSGGEKIEKRLLERFFEGPFSDMVCNKTIRLTMICLFMLAWVPMIYLGLQVTPSTRAEQFFPSDHPFQRIFDINNNAFGASSEDSPVEIAMVWGIDTMDRKGVNILVDPLNKGNIKFDEEFVFDGDAQQFILSICEGARELEFLKRDPDSPLLGTVSSCFVQEWKNWLNATDKTFPMNNVTVAIDSLNLWMKEGMVMVGEDEVRTVNQVYGSLIGLTEDKLYFASIILESQISANGFQTYTNLQIEHDKFEKYAADMRETGETGHNRVWQTALPTSRGTSKWVFMHTQSIYLSSAVIGAITGGILAFFVILFATQSAVVAFCSFLNISSILASVLASMVLMGWELGTIESICLTILAGFSVDYVVHLAHAFVHSNKYAREDRVRDAFATMGVSVLSGMITSVGASLMLFLCTLQFFAKFGFFLCFTVAYSWLWANLFFMSLLATFGPNNEKALDNPAITAGNVVGKQQVEMKATSIGGIDGEEALGDNPEN